MTKNSMLLYYLSIIAIVIFLVITIKETFT
nr:MAG TPA: hypothetical protein [Herelleviridae sp.]